MVYKRLISITSPTSSSLCSVFILSPILNGLDDKSNIPAIALPIVFLEENPIIVPAATLIALAVIPLKEEKWKIIIVIAITINTSLVIE